MATASEKKELAAAREVMREVWELLDEHKKLLKQLADELGVPCKFAPRRPKLALIQGGDDA